MHTGILLAELSRRHVAILPHEAVAIAQKLIKGHCVGDDAEAPYGPLSADTVVIGADGHVQCRASAATPSVSEIAIFLQSLLEGQRVPGGLRYTLGRALLDVDAPPFDSVHDLSVALERFEDGDRDATVAGLVRRASAAGGTHSGRQAGAPAADRRRQTPSSIAALRQELRMADLQLYQARLAAPPNRFGESRLREAKRSSVLSAPVAACMLAGVALVMAGEVSERRAGGSTPTPAPAAVSEPSGGAASIARTTDIVLPAAEVEPVAPTPASLSENGAVVRTVSSPPKAKSNTRRGASAKVSNGASQGQARARRVNASRSAERSRKGVEDHDSFIERIRFEWDNPFKRGH
jgi:hypothetical protein